MPTKIRNSILQPLLQRNVFLGQLDCNSAYNRYAFHLSELICKSNASVFKGWCCKILKNKHSENGTRYFEEIRRTRIELILQIGTLCLRTGRSGRPVLTNWKHTWMESRETQGKIVSDRIRETKNGVKMKRADTKRVKECGFFPVPFSGFASALPKTGWN